MRSAAQYSAMPILRMSATWRAPASQPLDALGGDLREPSRRGQIAFLGLRDVAHA
jgi:hypothetical protein